MLRQRSRSRSHWMGDTVADAGFAAHGCGAAAAAGSAVVTLIRSRPLLEAARIGPRQIAEELGGLSPAKLHAAELAADTLGRALGDALRHADPVAAGRGADTRGDERGRRQCGRGARVRGGPARPWRSRWSCGRTRRARPGAELLLGVSGRPRPARSPTGWGCRISRSISGPSSGRGSSSRSSTSTWAARRRTRASAAMGMSGSMRCSSSPTASAARSWPRATMPASRPTATPLVPLIRSPPTRPRTRATCSRRSPRRRWPGCASRSASSQGPRSASAPAGRSCRSPRRPTRRISASSPAPTARASCAATGAIPVGAGRCSTSPPAASLPRRPAPVHGRAAPRDRRRLRPRPLRAR